MSEFGGSRTHGKTQHILVGLGSGTFAAAYSEFPEWGNKVYTKNQGDLSPLVH